jgi:phospholipid/cholesterol/gamma-HCH transport system ATP-binding protein
MPAVHTDPSPTAPAAAHVSFEDVSMAFGNRVVLHGLSCAFPQGRISVILGGSGSGKTTVLRLIGGLVHPQAGRITVCGRDISRLSEREMYDVRRKIGMMFQGGALLDSMTISDNLAFPLREHKAMSASEIAGEVQRQLDAVGLSDAGGLLPGQLSGGMVKRAALARAIIGQPEVLLCDEPFSGLDPISVKRIEALLQRINDQLGITMLVSSHHIRSTMRMADRVVLLRREGALTGTPEEFHRSNDPWVAEFFNEEVDETLALSEAAEPEQLETRSKGTARW